MSGYNRTSGQSYNYSQDGTYTDQYGNVIGTTGNSLDRAYYYWQSRAGSGAFTQVGEGLDRPEYGDRWKGHSEYNPAYSYYKAMGVPIRDFYYASDSHSEAEIESYAQLIEEFEAGPVSVVGSPEYTRAQEWFREAVPTLISNTNVARDNLVDYFGMEKELTKIGYSEEEIGKALNKSKMSSYAGMAFSTGAESAGFADAYTKLFNEAKIYGGITEDFQKAYDIKAPEYHDKNFARLVSLSMTDPQAYQREYAKMNLRDKNVYMFKAYDKGLFEDSAERTRLEEAGVAPEEINKRIELGSMNKYKEAIVSNLHESGNYDDVYKRPATGDAELLGFDVAGGDPESEWVVKMKGNAFQDAGGTSGGQYGYRRIKFFPEETLRASGVYGPESKYNNYLQSESSLEEKLARQSVGKMETIGGLGEYVDVSPEDETLLEGVVSFADLALSMFVPTYNLIKIGVNAAQGETLHLADYISAGVSALQVFDVIAAPMGVEEAAEVGATASANVLEAGGTATEAARASERAIALASAGKGLTLPGMSEPLTYAQTVGLANSITEGNPAAFILGTFGGDMLDAAFAKYGVDPANLPAGVKEGIVKAISKVGQGEDWDEALSSGAYAWFKSSDLGDGFLGELQQVGRDIDSTYLQPLKDSLPDLGGVVGDWPVWGEISESTGQLIDGFQDIIGGMNDLVPGITDFTQEIANSVLEVIPTESIEEALSKIGQMTGGAFNELPAAAQDALEEGLQSAIIDGEVDSLAMAEAVSAAVITTDAINEAFPERLTDVVSARIITSAVRNSITAAMSGGDVSDAFVLSIAQGAANAAKKSIREGTWKDDLQGLVDRVEGDYTDTNNLRADVDKGATDYATKAKEYNDLVTEMNSEEAEVLRLSEKAASTGAQADEAAFNAARDAFQTKVVDTYAPQLSTIVQDIDSIKAKRDEDVSKYTASLDNLDTATVLLNDNLTPVYADIDKLAVEGINPDFDVKFYAQQNGITEEEAYKDYLTNGLYTNIPANPAEFAAEYATEQWGRIATSLGNLNIDMTKLTAEQITNLNDTFARNYSLRDLDAIDQGSVDRNMLATLVTDINGGIKVTEETNKLLSEAGLPPQEIGANVTLESVEAITKLAVDKQETQEIKNPYLNGATLVPNAQTGLMEWSDTSLKPTFRWNETAGAFVQSIKLPDGGYQNYDMKGNKVGKEYIRVTSGAETDLEWLAKNNPDAFVKTLADMDKDQWLGNEWWLQEAKDSVARGKELYGEDSKANLLITNAWLGTGQVLQAIQSTVAVGLGINPTSTPFYKSLDEVIKIAETGIPKETKENTDKLYKMLADAEPGVLGAAEAIFGAFTTYPSEFTTQIIGLEGVQELVPLLVAFSTRGPAGAAARFAGYSDRAAAAIAARAGLSAALTTDVAEAFGGTFNGAYEESYAVALKSGMSEEQADTWAIDAATTTATAAATFALISAGVGGQALEKMYISGGAGGRLAGFFDDVARRIENGATVFVKEGGTELLEESGAAVVSESLLFTLDPTRDVSGNIAMNGFMGLVVAGPISGTTALFASDTGNPIVDAVLKYNPEISTLLGQENISQEALREGLESAGISGAVQDDLMNFLYDEVYTSTAEATAALEALGIPYTQEDVTNNTGETADDDLDDQLAAYWAATQGTDTDTDGDGIPNVQDNEPNDPNISGIDIDPDTQDTSYVDADGRIVVTSPDGVVSIFNSDGTPVTPDSTTMPIIGDEDVDKDPDVDVDDTIDEDSDVDVDGTIDEDSDVDVDGTIDEDSDVDVDDTIDEDSDVDVDGTIDEASDVDVDDTIDEDSDVDVDGTIDEDSDVGLNADAIADAQLDIDALVEQGFTRDEAIAAVADQLGTTATELTTAIGTVETAVGLNADAIADAQLDIDGLVESGVARDTAIATIAEDLGTTEANLTALLEANAAGLDLNAQAIADAQLGIDALVEQGSSTQDAVAEIADQLGTTAQALATAIGGIDTAVVGVSSEVQALSELIGKPASAITATDMDFYADHLAQQEVLSEVEQASFVPTDQQLQYDVNNDGVIDIADQTLATQSFQGQDVDLAGKFAATGLYAGQQALDARLQDQLDSQLEFEQQQALEREQELEREQALEVQQQIAASASVEAANQEKYEEGFRQLAASNARGTIKTNKMGLAEIGPQYDFKSIFADQKDASMAMTPYGANQQGFFGAKAGGRVESDTDKLIRLIGEQ